MKSPVTKIPEMVNGSVPVFDNVTVWAALLVSICWLPKLRPEGDNVPIGSMPFPDKATVVGLVGASLPMLSVAVAKPVDSGVNSSSMLQLPAGGTPVPQLPPMTLR